MTPTTHVQRRDPLAWTARATCADRPDLPWTTDAALITPWQAATMRALCDECPVVLDCLATIDDLDITGGWWAGHDRDPHAELAHLAPPDFATPAATPAPAPAAHAEPALCWIPRSRRGQVFEQGAYLLQRDDTGAWHLGGVA